jgi:uncharacterized protein YggE
MRNALIMLAGMAVFAGGSAQAATEGELHIEARGAVMADYAVITTELSAFGRGKPAAEAQIKAQAALLTARLLKAGVPQTAFTLTPPVVEQRKEEEELHTGNLYAILSEEVMEAPAYGTADAEDAADESAIAAAEGANAAAAAADEASAAARKEALRRKARKLPWFDARFTATIRIDDLRIYPAVAELLNIRTGPGAESPTDFRFKDPATVHARAVADAVAKARTEADVYAKAIGGRVTRIARISNTETPVSGPEIVNLISTLDGRKHLWKVPATHSASVAVDYVVSVD